jgi:hypothetical protein
MKKAVQEYSDYYGLLDSLIEKEVALPLDAGDITVGLLQERARCSWKKAKEMLLKWTKEGKAEYIGKRQHRGHAADAWRLVVSEKGNAKREKLMELAENDD